MGNNIKAIEIRGVSLGPESPQICLALTSGSAKVLEEEISRGIQANVNVFEYRMDLSGRNFLDSLGLVRKLIGDRILIFTYRSKAEGGEGESTPAEYQDINLAVAKSGLTDIIDIELEKGPQLIESICKNLKKNKSKNHPVIQLSKHDFAGGWTKEAIIESFLRMQEYPVAMTKLAVYANHEREAIELLEASLEMRDKYGDRPFTAIAMGEKGQLSRIGGGFTGSALIFAKGEKASAPGQPDVETIKAILKL